ncbi:LOW QUALITY PROTEIN: beta-1,4-galactosyltransferase 1-like [Osmerus mordax]|uniref:LOW QUALITY PROTEIN: beta-1,4-galactosyltransferase 1-like n=1 Tax=Osmerus mordax TaxID=8014 RepID=UPI00350F35F4
MLKCLFVFMLFVVGLCLLEYSVFQLHNPSMVIVANRFLNQSELSRNSNQVLKWLYSNISKSNQGEGAPGLETDPPVGDTESSYPSVLLPCEEPSPLLVGPSRVDFSRNVTLAWVEQQNPRVWEGGWWRPRDCLSEQRVAVIVPFRNREEHLKFFLLYLHPLLLRQRQHYGVYVINQAGEGKFNKAKLMNIGYTEALKDLYNCFIFNDVDLVPMDDRNMYTCSNQPRHLSVLVDKFGFRLPYPGLFGGVTALNSEQFEKINGCSNNYWGWGGGEDDDVANRILLRGMMISRPDGLIGKYRMIKHGPDKHNEPNPQRHNMLSQTKQTMDTDGLNSLSYTVLQVERHRLYTNITVDAGSPT